MKRNLLVSLIMTLLSVFSLSVNGVFIEASFVQMLAGEVNGVGIDNLIVFIALFFFFMKSGDKFKGCRHWTVYFLAVVFSGCMLIGLSYSKNGNWDFIFGNHKQFFIATVVFCGFAVLFIRCLKMIYILLDSVKYKNARPDSKVLQWIDEHYFWWTFAVIFICWTPFLIVFFPGSVPHDGYYQLNMAFGINELTNQHSWSLTLIFGAIMRLGRLFSDNFGVFLIALLTSLAEAACYACVCCKIKKWGMPHWMKWGSVLFFAGVPFFGAYAQAVEKDSIYVALFVLYMAIYADICICSIRKDDNIQLKGQLLYLFGIGFLLCIFRNNGSYLILPASFCLLFFVKKEKRKYVLLMGVTLLACFYGYKNYLTPLAGVQPESSRVLYSIPFQQTARYLKEHPDEVTEEEVKAIEDILSYGKLAENYNPELSDPVKNTYNNSATSDEIKKYFLAWFWMFTRHPGIYLEATLHNTFGYYYPFYNCNVLGAYQFYIKGEPIATGEFDIDYVMPWRLRSVLNSYAELWRFLPGLAQVMNPGTYTWLLLIIAGYIIYKKQWKSVLVLIAPALNVAVCIASPVNGLLRYAMPLMACMPVLICWCLECGKKCEKQ